MLAKTHTKFGDITDVLLKTKDLAVKIGTKTTKPIKTKTKQNKTKQKLINKQRTKQKTKQNSKHITA